MLGSRLVQVLRFGGDLCAETGEYVGALFDEDQCKRCTIACQPVLGNRLALYLKPRNHGVFLFCTRSLHPAHQLHCQEAVKEIVKTLFALQQLEEQERPSKSSTVAALRKRIPGQILARYDTQRARGRRSVAIAHKDICGECHLKIPIAVQKALVLGADVQICTNCGRYLIVSSEGHSALKTSAA